MTRSGLTLLLGACSVLATCSSEQRTSIEDPTRKSSLTPPLDSTDDAKSAALALEWIGHDESRSWLPLRFRATNVSSEPVWLRGFSLNNLVTRVEVAYDERWVDATELLACGVGIRWLELAPGSSAEFPEYVHLKANPTLSKMRVGIVARPEYSGEIASTELQTFWTPSFVPDFLIDHNDRITTQHRLDKEQ